MNYDSLRAYVATDKNLSLSIAQESSAKPSRRTKERFLIEFYEGYCLAADLRWITTSRTSNSASYMTTSRDLNEFRH